MSAAERQAQLASFALELERSETALASAGVMLEQGLCDRGVDAAARYRAQLVLEELAGNALRYGRSGGGPPWIRLEVAVHPDRLELVLLDDGGEFDPTAQPDPEPMRSVEGATVGGRGIAMVRCVARRFAYRRENGRNRIEIELAREFG